MKSSVRIVLAFIISFLPSTFISLLNGRDLFLSFQYGFIFAVLVTVMVAILSWGIDFAVAKGYPGWSGFLLVLILNVFGLFLLAVIPNKPAATNNVSK